MRLRLAWCPILMLSMTRALAGGDAPCTAHDGDNYYDLSPLKARKDYEFEFSTGAKFAINVCKPIVSEKWALKIDHSENVGGIVEHERGSFAIGNANTSLLVRNGHPVLIMTDGSPCPDSGGMAASTAVRFICDTSVFGAGQPELVAQLPPDDNGACAFFIEWRTHVACPTHEKTGVVGFFAVVAAIIGTLLMLYILVGTFYNRYILELRGFDQIPRIPCSSFNDASDFIHGYYQRLKGSSWHPVGGGNWARRDRGGYRGLGEEEGELMAGPPGFLDEQDEDERHDETPATESTRPVKIDSDGVVQL